MRRTLIAAAFGLLGSTASAAAQPEAAEAFGERQSDLVLLASRLGTLHRLHQVCHPEEGADKFRRSLMALIPLEVPKGSTRLDMISAFNGAYRVAATDHLICGREARAAYAAEAEAALVVTERLYAPFR